MLKITLILLFSTLFIGYSAKAGTYPSEWWTPVTDQKVPGWEVLPQAAKEGEVILSKRTALGVFSNLAHTPFELDGVKYASIEGLWQGMKYPDTSFENDERLSISGWKNTREQVFQMYSWDSKEAGNFANQMYADNNLKFINYFEHKFIYTDGKEGSEFHLALITRAITAKVMQNPELKNLLLQTKGLRLRPDHIMSEKILPSFKYHEILMKIRDEME
jgi:hypothetical protein